MNFDLYRRTNDAAVTRRRILRAEYGFDARNKIVASEPGMSREHWRFSGFGLAGRGLPKRMAVRRRHCQGRSGRQGLGCGAGGRTLPCQHDCCSRCAERGVARAGSPAQRSAWLPGLAFGRTHFSTAHTEVDARHDLAMCRPRRPRAVAGCPVGSPERRAGARLGG